MSTTKGTLDRAGLWDNPLHVFANLLIKPFYFSVVAVCNILIVWRGHFLLMFPQDHFDGLSRRR